METIKSKKIIDLTKHINTNNTDKSKSNGEKPGKSILFLSITAITTFVILMGPLMMMSGDTETWSAGVDVYKLLLTPGWTRLGFFIMSAMIFVVLYDDRRIRESITCDIFAFLSIVTLVATLASLGGYAVLHLNHDQMRMYIDNVAFKSDSYITELYDIAKANEYNFYGGMQETEVERNNGTISSRYTIDIKDTEGNMYYYLDYQTAFDEDTTDKGIVLIVNNSRAGDIVKIRDKSGLIGEKVAMYVTESEYKQFRMDRQKDIDMRNNKG